MAKDIGKVLKAGKAFKGALTEAKDGRGSSKAVDLEVPLNTEFCGTTLRKLMKDEGITREEATAVFLAWQASCKEQGLPSGPAPKVKASKAATTRVTGKRPPPDPEQPATKKPKKAKAEDPCPDPMVFAPARAKDVADFFGTEKNKVLKNKKQESADEVEDLDGEPWDENEGWGEEWGEQEWEGWGGSTDEFDWEAAYPGFWDDYWQHKYGDCLGAKLDGTSLEPNRRTCRTKGGDHGRSRNHTNRTRSPKHTSSTCPTREDHGRSPKDTRTCRTRGGDHGRSRKHTKRNQLHAP